ncbi:MAG: T9SS type A sorting domain-containing protein [Ignavibacteriaceae bacterium]|nr:T9SS type A sorting domain-containing protein [Ignavibacteriaceae bacterium]
MKKIFLIILFVSLSFQDFLAQSSQQSSMQSDSIYFPLDIGNKFFYQGGREPDNGFYSSTKAIIDSFANGTRVISVTNYYIDSTSNTTEYWLFSDNKFYAASYYPFSFDFPVFNGSFTEDTCVYIFSKCYYIFYSTIFNQNRFCEMFSDTYSGMTTFTGKHTYTANNIGIYFKLNTAVSMGYSSRDSIQLIGFINNGILIGDSILTNIKEPDQIIYLFNLNQNFPNPFNPSTKISWQTPIGGWQTLTIYDVLGREVVTLVNEYRPPGNYEVTFDASSLSSGIYFYKLQVGAFVETKKMILLK